jgi:NAD dependent epimerase/dehydratase family enzyme
LPLRARYGSELVQHLLVEGQRVLPRRLEATGYRFAHSTLEDALRAAVDRH